MTGRKYASLAVDPGMDQEWCALRATTQLVYTLLLRDPEISKVGVVDYAPMRWAQWVADLDAADIAAELAALEAARYVIVDPIANRLLVRSYVRHDGTKKNPKHAAGVIADARKVRSPLLREVLAAELARCPDDTIAPSFLPLIRALQQELSAGLPIANRIGNPLPIAQPVTNNHEPCSAWGVPADAATAGPVTDVVDGPSQPVAPSTAKAKSARTMTAAEKANRIFAAEAVRKHWQALSAVRSQSQMSVEKQVFTALGNGAPRKEITDTIALLATAAWAEENINSLTMDSARKAVRAAGGVNGAAGPRTLGTSGNAPSGLLALSEGRNDRDHYSGAAGSEAVGF